MCLPTCPTYGVAHNEAESPRGRIAFAQALAGGQANLTPSLEKHLDQCLACMACERVCPSHVRYSELIVATRAMVRSRPPRSRGSGMLAFALSRPRALRAVLALLDWPLLRRCVASRAAQRILRPLRLDRAAAELPRPARRVSYPAAKPAAGSRGRVGVFLGCVASAVDRDVHSAAAHLLRAMGYEPVVPRGQGCCGALAAHAGDLAAAERLAAPTRAAFERAGVDTLLVTASGCFGTLRDRTFAGSSLQVCDIHEFLHGDAGIADLRFRPLDAAIALHTPCTQANVVRSGDAIRSLLGRIPQLRVHAMPAQPGCCGAAGDYFLRHPEIADTLRSGTLDGLPAAPDLLVTSNVGCRIFLDNALRRRGRSLPVVHPIALLAQQLDN